MTKRRFPWGRILLLIIVLTGVGAAFRFGLVPAKYSPLPRISLGSPGGLFLDWQLAEMKNERELCAQVLKGPYIDAAPVADNPIKNGCGWENNVRVSKAGGARISVDKMSCPVATALTLWLEHEVQPLALSMLGSRVASVSHLGTYSCRNIVGNAKWTDLKSEHATANAIDIGGFTLENGRAVSIQRDWKGTGVEAQFLKAVHQRACRYFRVALSPEFNAAHHDHLHLDRGILWTCK